jgi:hypothetical protein
LFSYDHELKLQKARENARRTEKEKEAERYETLMHDFLVKDNYLSLDKFFFVVGYLGSNNG